MSPLHVFIFIMCKGCTSICYPDCQMDSTCSTLLRRPIVPPIVLAKKGVIGGFLHVLEPGCKFAFLHQAGLCTAQTRCVSHFRPQCYTF